MRYSKYFIPTLKEIPSDAEIVSHQLMLRAGMIRKLTAGIYTYLPIGLRSLKKIEKIIREEMNQSGAIEILMPAVQPAELWQESGRWDFYGRELLRFKDRHDHDACLGPTHEEIITDLARREIRSYKQMPINLYQIQTKFRDEIRPRFGVMRAREFIMKDAYSFDMDEAGAEKSYGIMRETYMNIFRRCGFRFRAVEADTGSIGGSFSHEFMVLADTGEDQIVNCSQCSYAANLEKAEVKEPDQGAETDEKSMLPFEEVETPNMKTVEEVTSFLSISPQNLVKTLIFKSDEDVVAALVRGDHDINEAKLKNILGAEQLDLADPQLVEEVTGAPLGFAGPIGLDIKIIADNTLKTMQNMVVGGNKKDLHIKNANLKRDFTIHAFGDLRFITPHDPCPRCGGTIEFGRGIEVGHIFKLGTKYSKTMKAIYLDENGKEQTMVMGCYGIGVSRIMAASIEQNHDNDGIVFPIPIAPFEVVILPLQMNEPDVISAAEAIYQGLLEKGVDVLIDDRDLRAGFKFKDADLLGTPLRIAVGTRALKDGHVEMKWRHEKESSLISFQDAPAIIMKKINNLYDSIK
ncbi:MAG: proline--tRNA ligase [Deltaproteobacteria bacterium]|nr:proline--tRNA ligase [Deltaproteobacteria bacterium]